MAGRALIVEADGGSRGNPGIAGFGALVRDAASGVVLVERAEPLGRASNNVAEYAGLIAGLEAAVRIAPDADVEVRMDSKLVVEQMSGRWQIKHEDMRRLAAEARAVVRTLTAAGGRVRYTWIPRDKNKAADALSNLAMDGRSVDRVPGAEPTVADSSDSTVPAEGTDSTHPEPDSNLDPISGLRISPVARMDSGRDAALTGATRLVLVRHGVTDLTVTGRLDGRGGANPPLNELGHRQAARAASVVQRLISTWQEADAALGDSGAESSETPVHVITSSLNRARLTGAAIASVLGVTPTEDRDWDERGFGEWDGLTFAEIGARHPAKLARMRMDTAYGPPGGESRDVLAARVREARDRALGRGGTVVVATSRVPILVVLSDALGIAAERFWSIQTEPTSVSVVEFWPDGGVSVPVVNLVDPSGPVG